MDVWMRERGAETRGEGVLLTEQMCIQLKNLRQPWNLILDCIILRYIS